MLISKSLLNNPTGTRLFCVYSLNFYKLKTIKHQMRLAGPSICCAVCLQMVALKVKKKRDLQRWLLPDSWDPRRRGWTQTSESVAGFNLRRHFSISMMWAIQRSWGCLSLERSRSAEGELYPLILCSYMSEEFQSKGTYKDTRGTGIDQPDTVVETSNKLASCGQA